MTYQEALEKVNSRLLFGVKPGLERMAALMAELGNPQLGLKYVHVCGTNGKGTTCALTASVLKESGYKTGFNTSPYVKDFRERFQIDGEMISQAELAEEVRHIWPFVERLEAQGIGVSEFELVTAIALDWFARKHCDIVVLETGMGGLMDATNIIPVPEVAVMTSVSLDHTAFLGDTVEQIAQEKSGIFKEGGQAVLYPEQQPGVRELVQRVCQEKHVTLTIPRLNRLAVQEETIAGTELEWDGLKLHTPFLGEHQVKNAATALAVIEILRSRGFAISDNALRRGFQGAFMPARMEVISRNPLCLLDGGHNPGCAQALKEALTRFVPGRKVAIVGMMADKDSASALSLVGPLFQKMIAVRPENPRALSAGELAETAARFCPEVQPAESCAQALEMALASLGPEDALVVCGSFYLAGEIRDMLLECLGEESK